MTPNSCEDEPEHTAGTVHESRERVRTKLDAQPEPGYSLRNRQRISTDSRRLRLLISLPSGPFATSTNFSLDYGVSPLTQRTQDIRTTSTLYIDCSTSSTYTFPTLQHRRIVAYLFRPASGALTA